mmetsp:Transcript_28308/g.45873  ORF Transcript_28308/g.45873 Transcript_28308/m.45873 type:complete len:313 (+) Transcript_28308:61-999(+)
MEENVRSVRKKRASVVYIEDDEDEEEEIEGAEEYDEEVSESSDDEDNIPVTLRKQKLKETVPPEVEIQRKKAFASGETSGHASNETSPEKQPNEEDRKAKTAKSKAPAASLPLVLPNKINKNMLLVQCEDSRLDLSGDIGTVGRMKVDDEGLILDLKGYLYSADVVPCMGTVCLVSMSSSEAKIESTTRSFLQLNELSNMFDKESLIEGSMADALFEDFDDSGEVAAEEKLKKKKTKKQEEGSGSDEETEEVKKSKKKKIRKLGADSFSALPKAKKGTGGSKPKKKIGGTLRKKALAGGKKKLLKKMGSKGK